jgi:hypothetical protein
VPVAGLSRGLVLDPGHALRLLGLLLLLLLLLLLVLLPCVSG